MDKAQFRLLHNRKGQLNRDGKALVQIEAYLNAKKKYFSTNIYLVYSQTLIVG